jgi:hypothetical protein
LTGDGSPPTIDPTGQGTTDPELRSIDLLSQAVHKEPTRIDQDLIHEINGPETRDLLDRSTVDAGSDGTGAQRRELAEVAAAVPGLSRTRRPGRFP